MREALANIRAVCGAILAPEIETYPAALSIAERYGSAIFDALMIAAVDRSLIVRRVASLRIDRCAGHAPDRRR